MINCKTILIVEDLSTDIVLIQREIQKVLPICNFICVVSKEDYINALNEIKPDIILSDYRLPNFDGMLAIKLAIELVPDTPIIIVTGSLDEDTAVNCIKAGAWDYIIKDHLKRIGPAIMNSLEQKNLRLAKKQTLKALHESEERYRNIFELAPVGIVVLSDFKIVYANPAWLTLIGAKSDKELIGMHFSSFIHPDCLNTSMSNINRLLSGEKDVYPKEEIFIRLDGSHFDVEIMASLLNHNNKQAVQIFIRNITLRKKAEHERESLLELNRSMFNGNDAIMLLLQPETGKLLDANPAASEFYGYTKEELINLTLDELNILPRDVIKNKILTTSTKKQIHRLIPHKLKSGEIRLVDVYACPITHMGEKKLYAIVFDVTEREKYKEELYQEKEYLNNLIQYTNAPIITWTSESKITEFNEASERLTGRSREAVLGQPLETIFPQEKRTEIIKYIKKALEGENWDNLEIPIVHTSGEIRQVLWNSANIKNTKGVFVATIAQGTDITELKKAEEDLMYLSYHDHLTKLYNRRFFEVELKRLDKDRNLPLTIVMGDVNGLKLINDSFGHNSGDILLKNAAKVIKNGCRADDIIARVGGDEFAIILPNTNESETEKIILRIKDLAHKVELDKAVLSVSFGYATKHTKMEKLDDIIAKAENHMYKHKMYESASMRNKTIDVIMNALFEKSVREMMHSKRVSAISATIASKLGFDQDEINKIRMAALVHDIGKIGIDEKILNKPKQLDEHEWIEIKKHPESGWRILSSVSELSDLAKHILYHHEFWDGTGYPKGLKGEDIPIEARIIAVADTYDAMKSKRTYKNSKSKKEVVQELLRCAGKQFDPNIVNVFLTHVLGVGHNHDNE